MVVYYVRDYCRSCPECQKKAKREPRAPMVPMPVIGTLFQCIAMDVVRPLLKTASGNQYVLVICDYATQYRAAYPLQTFTAPNVAERLIDFFSLHGIPSKILTDQETNFTSVLLKELYQLLGVKAITTSQYTSQTDELVGRFNRTLKLMLSKTILEARRSWDKLIPLDLFAYREVSHETTGFSPFELTCTHQVQGSMNVLKEAWIPTNEEQNDIATFVMDVHTRMQEVSQVVQESKQQAQIKQKIWYNHNTHKVNYQARRSSPT